MALIEEKIAEQTELLQSAGTDTRQEKQARLDMFAGLLESTKAIRDHYLPNCETQDHYLLRPTQKQMNDCRTHPSVRIEKKDGSVHFDQDAFKEQLLIKCLEGKTREEVLALPPDVYERLFVELWKVCYPSASDLRFTKARLSPP